VRLLHGQGLRFGGDYSVYPSDPFRYHAHYLANGYGWDEEVAMLDLATSGRPRAPPPPINVQGSEEISARLFSRHVFFAFQLARLSNDLRQLMFSWRFDHCDRLVWVAIDPLQLVLVCVPLGI
jgi:hypothetical protein